MPYLTILVILLVLLLFLAAFLLIRAVMFGKPIEPVDPIEGIKVDPPVVAEHLAAAIRKPTISKEDMSQIDGHAFWELHRGLEAMYPRVHATLDRREINTYGLLYTWKGRKPDLEPILLAAHLDVVPVEEAGLGEWEYPPFSGQIADGFVWGRGTLDIKSQAVTILEAVENLLKEGYRPERTIYIAFGHDEEVSGKLGAGTIARILEEEGIHLEAVLDEGGGIMTDLMPGIKSPVATVGIAEKGYLSLELISEGAPGHSSTPPESTAIGRLGAALARLEANPMPLHLHSILPMMQSIGAVLPFSMQLLFGNLWLFGGLVGKRLAQSPTTAATVRTTQAVTMISGGVMDNLLPREARAVINYRLLPGDTIAGVCERVRKVIGEDQRLHFQPKEGTGVREASPVSSTGSDAFRKLSRTVRQIFPDVVVAPYLVLGATDARYYQPICENVYRFTPMIVSQDDLHRVHGTNERIAVENLGLMVQFFAQLMKAWGES